MLSREENELITRVTPGTPMGDTMRRYWMPALLASEIAEPDSAPVRVRLLGEVLPGVSRHRRPHRPGGRILPASPRLAVFRPK